MVERLRAERPSEDLTATPSISCTFGTARNGRGVYCPMSPVMSARRSGDAPHDRRVFSGLPVPLVRGKLRQAGGAGRTGDAGVERVMTAPEDREIATHLATSAARPASERIFEELSVNFSEPKSFPGLIPTPGFQASGGPLRSGEVLSDHQGQKNVM